MEAGGRGALRSSLSRLNLFPSLIMELDQLLASLNTPEVDGRDPSASLELQDTAAIDALRKGALSTLASLRDKFTDDMTPTLKADCIAIIAQYYTSAPWATSEVHRLALGRPVTISIAGTSRH